MRSITLPALRGKSRLMYSLIALNCPDACSVQRSGGIRRRSALESGWCLGWSVYRGPSARDGLFVADRATSGNVGQACFDKLADVYGVQDVLPTCVGGKVVDEAVCVRLNVARFGHARKVRKHEIDLQVGIVRCAGTTDATACSDHSRHHFTACRTKSLQTKSFRHARMRHHVRFPALPALPALSALPVLPKTICRRRTCSERRCRGSSTPARPAHAPPDKCFSFALVSLRPLAQGSDVGPATATH